MQDRGTAVAVVAKEMSSACGICVQNSVIEVLGGILGGGIGKNCALMGGMRG